jgi:putative transposase
LSSTSVGAAAYPTLRPTPVQAAALEVTLHACNEAASWVSGVAFEKDVKRNFALREHTYTEVKRRWGLGAQAAQHVIKKTCDAYRTLAANAKAGNLGKPWSKRYRRAVEKPVVFRPEGAQPYDDRMLSWQITERTVSLWTLSGRVKGVAFTASPEQLARLALYRKGESDLLHRDGKWFLNATCEVSEAEPNTTPAGFLGLDLGIVNIATTSDGEILAGRALNRGRLRERTLRTKLQKKNTPSAKRRLKKRRRKEARRAKDINHKIAKHVVAEAERTSRGIALGRPHGHPRAGTASQAPTGHPLQLELRPAGAVHRVQGPQAGVPVVYVDPAYTSRACAECGHVDKANRVSRAPLVVVLRPGL